MNELQVMGNATVIQEELTWLCTILDSRLAALKGEPVEPGYFLNTPPPTLSPGSPYAELVATYQLDAAERLLLICALAPHIAPEAMSNKLRDSNGSLKITHIVLGGYFESFFNTFVPTLQTVLYLLAGEDMATLLYYQVALTEQGRLINEQIITLQNASGTNDNNNLRHQVPTLAPEYIQYIISGKTPRPDFGKDFPATIISTSLSWNQLVVPASTRQELQRIGKWSQHGRALIDRTGKKLNGSFTCLFYGPSGGGKTLAVQLLGASLGVDVFRIDLSMVVSKYIGETEKNLAFLFDRAKNKNWILFFDEADALFGKRTDISDSKDKWANLEMSYLLQRMEEHNGLTVLATNLKNNLDPALARRFQSVIYFNRPDKEQRAELWQKLMPEPFIYDAEISFERLAKYELTGGNITNIIKAACLEAHARQSLAIDNQDIADAIKREFQKENRAFN